MGLIAWLKSGPTLDPETERRIALVRHFFPGARFGDRDSKWRLRTPDGIIYVSKNGYPIVGNFYGGGETYAAVLEYAFAVSGDTVQLWSGFPADIVALQAHAEMLGIPVSVKKFDVEDDRPPFWQVDEDEPYRAAQPYLSIMPSIHGRSRKATRRDVEGLL
jgi:hypothetical protein